MKKSLSLLAALCLGGCVSTKPTPIAPDAVTGLQGEPLTIVTHAKPSFIAMTAGKGGFAMFGALAAIAEGNKLVETYQLPDPAVQVAAQMKPVLEERFKTTRGATITDLEEKITSDSALAAIAANKGVVLDVVTIGWGFSYFPVNWGHYTIDVNVNARLIDARTGKVIAQSLCIPPKEEQAKIPPVDPAKAPTYDEMMADNAALLKSRLAEGAAACATTIQKNMFGGW